MNILFYTTDMRFGGAQRVISILANKFSQQGHMVSIFMYNEYDTIAYQLDRRVSIEHLDNKFRIYKLLHNIKQLKFTRKRIIDFAPDVIISFYAIDTILAWLASKGLDIPIVYSQRCDPYNTSFKEHLYEKLAIRLAKHIVFQSTGAQHYYSKKTQEKSHIIFNPLQVEFLPKKQYMPDDDKKQRVIVAVGRLSEQKNHKLLITAFNSIKDDIPNVVLQIFGDGPLRESLQDYINSLHLQEHVILMGNKNNVTDYVSQADVFVLPSLYEGQPNALLEAMCIGVPCISTDWSPKGTIADLIKDGENGIIVANNNVEDMIVAIEKMLSDNDSARKMGCNATQLSHIINSDAICQIWLTTISEIVNK
ncbi:MAG: glycosyltransferase [Prevotella sp.]|nr:glycosyltransferase [Candidatus Equicola faecalis]